MRPATLYSNQNLCNEIFNVKKVKEESGKKRRESGHLEERAGDGDRWVVPQESAPGLPSGRGSWSLPLKAVVQVDPQ